MSIFGGLIQAQGQKMAGEASGQAYDFNANVAENNATQAIALSAQQERQQRIIGRKAVGHIEASYGASGVTQEGSALDVLAESMASAEMDALNIRYSGAVKSSNFSNEASLNRFNASSARAGGRIGAAATVLGTAAQTGTQIAGAFGGGA